MRLHPYTNISDKKVLFAPQFFDPDELAILRAGSHGLHLRRCRRQHRRLLAVVAAAAGPSARVLRSTAARRCSTAVYNIRQNPFGTIKAIACAVADKPAS
jgi:hypothetical protein